MMKWKKAVAIVERVSSCACLWACELMIIITHTHTHTHTKPKGTRGRFQVAQEAAGKGKIDRGQQSFPHRTAAHRRGKVKMKEEHFGGFCCALSAKIDPLCLCYLLPPSSSFSSLKSPRTHTFLSPFRATTLRRDHRCLFEAWRLNIHVLKSSLLVFIKASPTLVQRRKWKVPTPRT